MSPLPPSAERVELLGTPVDPLGPQRLVAMLLDGAEQDAPVTLFYANAHTLRLARLDPWFRRALRRADRVFCDGFGVRLVARILGEPPAPRATPPDWIDALAAGARERHLSLFLLGGEPGVAASAAAALRSRHPGLEIAGSHHGHFRRDGSENEGVLAAISASGAKLLLVGLGQPRQELWIDLHRARLPPAVLAVGALFEWLSGSDRRAPRWASDHGLEWSFRLLRHPLRHFRRYAIGLPALLCAAFASRLRRLRPAVAAGPLRVAFSFSPTDQGKSGAYRYLHDLLAALARDPGLALQVFVLDRDRALLPPGDFRIHRVSRLFAPALGSILWHHLALPLRARLAGAKVLHLPYANRRMATPARPPALCTVLDLAELQLPERYGRLRRAHAWALRRELRRAPLLVAISAETRRQLIAAGAEPERIEVIRSGHRPLAALPPERARAHLQEHFGVAGFDLLYVSRLEHPGKNHVRLFDALALLRGSGRRLSLALVGAPWTGIEAIEQRLAALKLEAQVHRLGFIGEQELAACYAAARALIFPSLVEGFGLPLVEAMSLGVPVACSDRPPMNEEFAGAVLPFDPEDPRDIAGAMVTILDDLPRRHQLIAAGQLRAAELSWEAAAAATLRLYQVLGTRA